MDTTGFTMITPFHNHDNGYISLVIKNFAELPDVITVEGKRLTRKGEFHISLMALKHLLPLINQAGHEITEDDLEQCFLDIQKEVPLSEFRLTHEFRQVKRGERETVVVMVTVPGIDELFSRLCERYGVALPIQPTHITMYTLQPEVGIGILSNEELERDSRRVSVPELATI